MQRAGDELLAGAALAGDEHGAVAARHGPDGPEHLEHLRALAHDAVAVQRLEEFLAVQRVHVLLQDGDVAFERARRDGVAHDVAQLRDLDRLGEVVVGAVLQRVDGGFGRRVAGDHDEDRVGGERLRLLEQLHAVQLAHADVGDDDVEGAPAQQLQRLER